MLTNRYTFTLLLIFILGACATRKAHFSVDYQPPTADSGKPDYAVLFFGGADKSPDNGGSAFEGLKQHLETTEKGALILLGNNGAKRGMSDSTAESSRKRTKRLLEGKLGAISAFKGDVFAVPGNHDWANGGRSGYQRILRLEEFLEDYLGENVLVPNNGCPGPYEVEIREGLVFLFLNTQWWLHEWEKGGPETGCEMEGDLDFIVQLDDALKRHMNKKIIIIGHHPLFSNGPHGGYFPAYTHLLPPVLGSVYAWYRKNRGGLQDLADTRYRIMRRGLQNILAQHPNLVYLSGHERSQQYHKNKEQHYIVSGAIAEATQTVPGNGARFAYGNPGFGKLNFYNNGDVYLEFWTLEEGKTQLTFREKLLNHIYDPATDDLETHYADLDYSNQTVNAIATTKLNKDQKRPGLLGKNYRTEWATEIKNVPVFDIGKEKGGMKIIKKGGGLQTISLRLEDKDGKQYVLRSIEKFPEKAVPAALRGTIASDIIADQVSASHPYGAFVIPKLAHAAGVYHTNPKLVYLPDDPRLGIYRDDFGDGLFLYEERPARNRSDVESFGRSKKIINTLDVIKRTQKDNEHYIDQDQVLRSRLFDIWIGDWDRHDDQWRWARFKDEEGFNFYQPIPRDRDQAFFWSDGLLIRVGSRRWGQPKFQGFHEEIRDVAGLSFNARHFDRTFLTKPDMDDWLNTARNLQERLTDEVIEEAIKGLPEEIYKINGENIIGKLKSRRQHLHTYARDFYLFLNKNVNILGSNKAELFEINHRKNGDALVKIHRIKEKSGEIKFKVFDRVFKHGETREIRLYGLGDDDRFIVTGESKNSIRVRIIGGKGKDRIKDSSNVSRRNTIVYDKTKNTTINSKNGLKNKTSDKDENINRHDRFAYKYDKVIPLVTGGFNPDDGVFIGGGISIIKHKFRKAPFGAKHNLTASLAPRSASYNFRYKGHFVETVGSWDLLLEADIYQPSIADFFYGFGNRTRFDEDARDDDSQFYRARFGQWILHTDLQKVLNDIHTFTIGGFFRSVNIESDFNDNEPNRFIITYPELIGRGSDAAVPLLDRTRSYVGMNLNYGLNLKNSNYFPTKGIAWNVAGKLVTQTNYEENDYQSIASDFSAYFTFGGSLKTTLALRVGGQANFGDFEFFQAPRLGGFQNLRGYRRGRFAGDESFYQNTDLRIKLLEYKTPLFPGSLGITFIHDIGRVWTDQEDVSLIDETKEEWHRGYGGGIWIAPLGEFVISADYTVSNDDERGIFVRFGFFF